MKALVAIKRVVDYNVKIRVKADGSAVDTDNVKMAINPFCEIALEEAIRMKEKENISEVVVVTIGDNCQDVLRHALALGADRAIHVETTEQLQPLGVAKVLKAVVEKETPEVVLLGKQSIDGDNNQTGQMLAALLDWPQATFASVVHIEGGDARVTREVDGGLETIQVNLPAVITSDLRLNEPRYANLPNIMKAKRKPIETLSPDSLAVTHQSKQTCLKVSPPPERKAGIKVDSVKELVEKLKNEAKVI